MYMSGLSKSGKSQVKLEFMYMKQNAPNRCEPNIEALKFVGGGGGGGGPMADMNGEVKFFL